MSLLDAIIELSFMRTNDVGRTFYIPQVRAFDRPEALAESTEHAARMYDLDPYYLLAVTWHESAFRSDAVSRVGCVGITQLCGKKRSALMHACTVLSNEACDDLALVLAAAELTVGIEQCGTEAGAISWYRAGRCDLADTWRVQQVLATRDRLEWGMQ